MSTTPPPELLKQQGLTPTPDDDEAPGLPAPTPYEQPHDPPAGAATALDHHNPCSVQHVR
jgi:hypothetical protein